MRRLRASGGEARKVEALLHMQSVSDLAAWSCRIVELSDAESTLLLGHLTRWVQQPRFTITLRGGPHSQPALPPPMTLSVFGMNLHAATTADCRDRKQLERICRDLLRSPFAHDAPDRFVYGPTRPYSVGFADSG